MTYKIDLFDEISTFGYPKDHRWDRDKNAKLLNIVYHGSTFGNFLKFMLDKFSKKTPEIELSPFTKGGTGHALTDKHFSGMVQRYHHSFINDNKGEEGLPVCVIIPSTEKHFLYLKKANWFRSSDQRIAPDDLWRKPYGDMTQHLQELTRSIRNLYSLEETAHFSWMPKFIVRDWYKLNFLVPKEQTFNFQWFRQLSEHDFFNRQKTFYLDLETFFNWDTWLENITKLDKMFGLELDFDRSSEMEVLFDKGISMDDTRQHSNMATELFDEDKHHIFKDMDVSTEAFIYAMFEKKYPDIQMPLTNRFFRDSEEIRQFIEHFPNWYRRPNPNIG